MVEVMDVKSESYFLVIDLPTGKWLVPGDGRADLTFEGYARFLTEFWSEYCALPEVKALLQEFGGVFVPSKVNG